MTISIILDVIISVLLVLTIAYAMRLNQRLSQLRADKNELQNLADIFVEATRRAEAGIAQLKISSDGLSADITQAETLKDDLDYLVERGERVANALMEETRTPPNTPYGKPKGLPKTPRDNNTSLRGSRARAFDPEARLIEDAIRAATPPHQSSRDSMASKDSGALTDREVPDDAFARGRLNTEISNPVQRSGSGKKGALRGLYAGAPSSAEDDDDGIGDSKAARELLKALGTVK